MSAAARRRVDEHRVALASAVERFEHDGPRSWQEGLDDPAGEGLADAAGKLLAALAAAPTPPAGVRLGRNYGGGQVLTSAKELANLPAGSVIRNGCDSEDGPEAGVHLVKIPSGRPRSELDHGHEWAWHDPATGERRPVGEELGIAIVSVDVFLPCQVIREGWPRG